MGNVRTLAWWGFWLMWGFAIAVLICRTVPLGAPRSAAVGPPVSAIPLLAADPAVGTLTLASSAGDDSPYPERLGDRVEHFVAAHLTPQLDPAGTSQRVAIVIVLLSLVAWWIGAFLIGAGGAGVAAGAVFYVLLLRSHLEADAYRWGMVFAPLIAGGIIARGNCVQAAVALAAAALVCWSLFEPIAGLGVLAVIGWAVAKLLEADGGEERGFSGSSTPAACLLCASGLSLLIGCIYSGWLSWLREVATPLASRKGVILEPLGLVSPQVMDGRGPVVLVGLFLILCSRTAARGFVLRLSDSVLLGLSLASFLIARGAGPLLYATVTLLLAQLIRFYLPQLSEGCRCGIRSFGPLVPLVGLVPVLFQTTLCETKRNLQSEAFNIADSIRDSGFDEGSPAVALRLFNDLRASEAIVHAGIPLFMDGRTLLVSGRRAKPAVGMNANALADNPTAADDYSMITKVQPGWEQAFNRWGFNGAILRRDSSLASVLVGTRGWKEEALSGAVPIVERGRKVLTSWVFLARPDDSGIARPSAD